MPFEKNYLQFLTKFAFVCVAVLHNIKRSKGHKNKLKGRMRPAGLTLAMSALDSLYGPLVKN